MIVPTKLFSIVLHMNVKYIPAQMIISQFVIIITCELKMFSYPPTIFHCICNNYHGNFFKCFVTIHVAMCVAI